MTLAFRATPPQPAATEPRPAPKGDAPVHDARHLTGPGQTGYIVLDDKTYLLRITRAGKLILTK